MKSTRISLTAGLFIGFAAATPVPAQEAREGFVRWARTHSVPVTAGEGDGNMADLLPLRTMIGDARVVALGEPAHGAFEPVAFRDRLFRFLVQEMGFTAVALETGFAESQADSDFVLGGLKTDAQSPHEPSGLAVWMREYNARGKRRVNLYGIDLGLGGMGNSFPGPSPIRTALAYLARVDAVSEQRMRTVFEPWLRRLPGGDRAPEFTDAERDGMTAAIGDLVALFERGRPAFIAATSEPEYARAHHGAVVARQADQVFRALPPGMRPGQIAPGEWRAASARDAAMAANVQWALEREGRGGRILVFAHNAHVKNAPSEGGAWSVFERPPSAMGQYLKSALGDDVVIIGMSAGRSRIAPPQPPAGPDSLDSALAGVGMAGFVIDLRRADQDAAARAWLTGRRTLTANSVSFLTLSPRTAFDLIFFTRELTPFRRGG